MIAHPFRLCVASNGIFCCMQSQKFWNWMLSMIKNLGLNLYGNVSSMRMVEYKIIKTNKTKSSFFLMIMIAGSKDVTLPFLDCQFGVSVSTVITHRKVFV